MHSILFRSDNRQHPAPAPSLAGFLYLVQFIGRPVSCWLGSPRLWAILAPPRSPVGTLLWASLLWAGLSGITGLPGYAKSPAVDPCLGITNRIYVTTTGTGTGSSWADAMSNLQAALNNTGGATEIWVAKGTYTTATTSKSIAFTLPSGIKLYGGFDGTEGDLSDRVLAGNETILSGNIGDVGINTDNSLIVMTINNAAAGTLLDGIIFSDANGNGAVSIVNSTVTVTNCTFRNNTSYNGGGLDFEGNSTITVSKCLFHTNTATNNGGAIFADDGTLVASDCVFRSNTAGVSGGAFATTLARATFSNCLFYGNSNTGYYGSVIYSNATAILENCTVFGNNDRGAIALEGTGSGTLKNCIVWGNSGSSPFSHNPPTVSYSIIQNVLPAGAGNVSADPLFVNAADPDGADNIFGTADDGLVPSPCSPAINAGTTPTTTVDLTGAPRIVGNAVDMGAYEQQSTLAHSVSITATPSLTITSGGSVTLTASGADSYTWSTGVSTTAIVVSNVTSATAFSVTGTTGQCSATASAGVSVTTVPVAQTSPATFTYTGAVQTFTVPACVTSLTVVANGAQGADDSDGGKGGRVTATLSVTPGQSLSLYVGGVPFNGGGLAPNSFDGAGAGGGATDIRIGGTELDNRILVAGGGGGDNFVGGDGGSQSAGAPGIGGIGGGGGGGGGGGYYGGGGGEDGGGGGGGSSYTDATLVTGVVHEQGANTGNGSITLSWAPSVAIAASPSGAITAGTSVMFTATPANGGTTPTYQWKKNSTNVGTNSPTYTDAGLANGDKITCVMTSNAACALPGTGTSNELTMTVSVATVTPSVTIAASSATICAGSSVTFTATPTNGGSSPTYIWKKGSTDVGTGDTYTTSTLANNDVITCVMTSNLANASPTTATSTGITMVVNALPATPVISGTPTFCPGTTITLSTQTQSGATYCWTSSSATPIWQNVGSAGFSAGVADYQRLAFNGSTPYVAYKDAANGNKTTVMKYNGTAWENVGSAGFSAGGAEEQSLAFNGNTPYVAYNDIANFRKATVMKYNGTAWENVGSAGFSAASPSTLYPSLAFNGSTPYVAYRDGGNGNKATVMKYNGTAWENVGIAGFSAGSASNPSLAFNGSTPYVAYEDRSITPIKATVMKYNGTAWENVGNPRFSAGYLYDMSLAFNGNTPYVAYSDGGNDEKTTVMKYNGTAWENVGGAGFSAGYAYSQSLVFNGSTPYVAYQDGGNGYKATLMKFALPCLSSSNSLSVNAAGTYTVTVDMNGCTAAASQSVTVNPTVTISIAATPSLTITSGGSVTLTASGADSYTWSTGVSTTAIVVSNVTSATAFSVTGVTGQCSATASAGVSVTTAAANCVYEYVYVQLSTGLSISFRRTTTTTNGALEYRSEEGHRLFRENLAICCNGSGFGWRLSPAEGSSLETITGYGYWFNNSQSETVPFAGWDPNYTDITIVLTSVSISPSSQTITSGGSVTLTASGATSYTWSTGESTTAITVSNVTSATTFSVTGVTGQCSATASAAVSVTTAATPVSLSATSPTINQPILVLNATNCPIQFSGQGWGKTFVMTGPSGYVYTTAFRTAITGQPIMAPDIRKPGTYTLTVYGEPYQTPVSYQVQVTGTGCN